MKPWEFGILLKRMVSPTMPCTRPTVETALKHYISNVSASGWSRKRETDPFNNNL